MGQVRWGWGTTETGVLSPPLSRWAAMAPDGPVTRPVGSSAVVPGTVLCEVLALSASPLSACVPLGHTVLLLLSPGPEGLRLE